MSENTRTETDTYHPVMGGCSVIAGPDWTIYVHAATRKRRIAIGGIVAKALAGETPHGFSYKVQQPKRKEA